MAGLGPTRAFTGVTLELATINPGQRNRLNAADARPNVAGRHLRAPDGADGIIYSSRLNDDTNLTVYDRAIGKLRADRTLNLIEAPGFADVLNALKVAVI
jgi:hypothetical protein